jgi:hypothetical protein
MSDFQVIESPVEPFDAYGYEGATPPPSRSGIAPLSALGERRIEIGWLVQQATPPKKWLDFGLARIESRAWYEWHWYRGIYPGERREHRRIRGYRRLRIIERDGSTCGLCGAVVAPDELDIDHIVPVSRGGSDEDDNLQVAHASCNRRKGAGF